MWWVQVFHSSTGTGTTVLQKKQGGWRRCMSREWEGISRYHLPGAMRSHYSTVLSVPPLAAPLLRVKFPNLPKISKPQALTQKQYKPENRFQKFLKATQILPLYSFWATTKVVVSEWIYIKTKKFLSSRNGEKEQTLPTVHISSNISPLLLFPPCLQHCCSKEKVTKIFEIIKGFGWVNLEWVKLLEKNLKDRSGMQSCYINIFWMVPSYAQPWRHNCIKWNFIQKLWKCTGVGWLSALSVPFQTWSKKAKVLEKNVDSAKRFLT